MGYQFTPLVVPFLGALVVLVVLGYFLIRLATDWVGYGLMLWTVATAAWCLSSVLKLSATTGSEYALWQNLRFVGPAFATVAFFLVATAYTNRERWLQRQYLLLLFVVPVVTNLLAWTNPLHGLIRVPIDPDATATPLLAVTHGPWYWVHAAYSYGISAVGGVWLVSDLLRKHRHGVYRGQAGLILLGTTVSLVPSALFNAGLTTVDWTPVGGAVTAVFVTIALFRYQLLDVSPIARDMVVETMDNAMLILDEEDNVVDANERASVVFDTGRHSLVGASLSAVTAEYPELATALGELEDGSETITVDGSSGESHYDVDVSPIVDDTGASVGRVVVFNDVTETVRRERQLEQQNERLDRQNEQLDRFASTVSHDLRNPLGIAQTYLDFAAESHDEDDFEAVREAHDRMDDMIDDLLAMARAGRSVEETEPVRLQSIAEAGWGNVTPNGATLDLDGAADATVEADPDRLLHVFENLFRNSVEHGSTDPGSHTRQDSVEHGSTDDSGREPPTVWVGLLDDDNVADASGFYVADDGPGIPEEKREKVFEHGYTTDDHGTGFGLSIVADVVEAHDWEIAVTESEAGGARFEIRTT